MSVALDGNTNVNGENGAGKTSLLRALPLFFGAAPSQIVRQSGNNRSFVDYYLESPTSYIAFEYRRGDEPNLAVAFRRDQSLVFRFLKAAYRDELFINEAGHTATLVATKDWASHVRLLGLVPSAALGITDYKKVIQSGQGYKGTGEDRKKRQLINEYRTQYAFCGRGSSIENIDLVATAILEREPSVEAIKEVLTSIFAQTEGEERTLESPAISSAKLTEWVNQRDAYLAVERSVADIRSLARLKADHGQQRETQRRCRAQAEVCIERAALRIGTEEEALSALERQRVALRDEHLKKEETKAGEEAELKGTLKGIESQLARQEQERNEFEDQGIAEKQQLVEELPRRRDERKRLQAQYDVLTAEAEGVNRKFERLLHNLQVDFQKQEAANLGRLRNAEIQQAERVRTLQEDKAQELEQISQRHAAQSDALHEERLALGGQLTELRTERRNVAAPQELLEEYEQVRTALEQMLRQEPPLLQAITDAKDVEAAHRREIEQATREVETARRSRQERKAELDRLIQLKDAPEGSLLSFLRLNHPTWTGTIAKVVPESLLFRNDLAPEHAKDASDLYGVRLDLSGVESPLAADEAAIQRRILEVDAQIAAMGGEIDRLEAAANTLIKKSRQFEHQVIEAQQTHKGHRQRVAHQQEWLELADAKIKAAKAEKAETLDAAIQARENDLQQLKERSQAQANALAQEKQAVNARYRQLLAEQDAALQAVSERLAQEKAADEAQYRERHDQIKASHRQALIEDGIDPEALLTVTDALQAAKDACETAEASEALVSRYTGWLATYNEQHPRLKRQQVDTNTALRDLLDRWKQVNAAYTAKRDELNQKMTQSSAKLEALKSEHNHLQQLCERYPDIEADPTASEPESFVTASHLEQQWTAAANSAKATAQEGNGLYTKILRLLRQYPDTSPYTHAQRVSVEAGEHEPPHLEWLWASDHLSEYLRDDHLAHMGLLQAQAKLHGQGISDYYERLKRTHQKINALGGKVSAHAHEVVAGFGAISDLTVAVRSNLDKLNFWSALKNFADSHQSWKARNDMALPDDTFIERLRTVATLLEQSGLSVDLAKSFEITFSVVDQGRLKVARTTKELENISSHGLSYLILIFIYAALVNMLRGKSEAVMMWPVDELRNFSAGNIQKIMALLTSHDIRILSAFPDPDPELLKHYRNRYMVKDGRTLLEYPDAPGEALADALEAALGETEEAAPC
ncbi:MAG: ATP-binding protein [Thiogranum sp.]|nr:ATP-binding protein [Thiogranum sp.]